MSQSPLAIAFAQHKAGRLAEAEAAYRHLLAAAPGNTDIAMLLGLLLDQRGVHDEAVQHLGRVAKAKSNDPTAHYNLALALQHAGRGSEAAAHYRRALALRPDYLAARVNLGNVLADSGSDGDAIAVFREGLARHGDQADLYFNLARVLQHAGQLDDARTHYRAALALKPDLAGAINNLGLLLQARGESDEAIALYRKGLATNPSNVDLLLNLGNSLTLVDRFEEAIAVYRRAQAVAPQNVEAHHFESFMLLLLGRFQEGWEAYEWRLRTPPMQSKTARYPQARWNGQRGLAGRLLIWNEQGVGDELMFLGLLPELAREMKLLVECDARLLALFRRSLPAIEFVARPPEGSAVLQWPADIAAQCPAGSLMRHLRPDLASFAPGAAYLTADLERRDALRSRYGGDRLRVGIAWHTTAPNAGLRRQLPLSKLTPLLRHPGARFISLQYGDHAAAIASLADQGIELWQDPEIDVWNDLDGWAAQIAALDLVVTIDNSTAHMAGALGVPCWVMLPHPPEWRWLLERTDCLWWPSLQLFRQTRPGDWDPVIAELTARLAERIASKRGGQALS
ncbi:tetratricopeptide repeat protein [Hypericibacter sp.]|uniref:tetratricopeptide repeat protein n=1 Tax=Hypericibacter sp. TaxID=2705401 RepID=UPI003D6D6CBA